MGTVSPTRVRDALASASRSLRQQGFKPAIYVAGMIPAVWTYYLAETDQLGADPVKVLERTLGLWGLRFLILALCITPLRRFGGPNLLGYRRAIGLVAFFYAALHVTVYAWLDQDLDLGAIWGDIVKRPYITVGLVALLILIPLAVTSHDRMIKRMGAAAWQKLHRWVYLASAAAALHFIMLVKSWPPEPLIYAGIVAALLAWRLRERSLKRARRSVKRGSGGGRPVADAALARTEK